MQNSKDLLARAAAMYGIEPEYIDIWGNRHATSGEVTRAILSSFGVPTNSDQDLEQFIEERAIADWSRALDSTLVVREDADSIVLRIPSERSGASAKLEIQWENGDLEHHWFWLPELRDVGIAHGLQMLAKRLPLPQPLRLGYHEIRVYWMQEPSLEVFGQARFIVCPKSAYGFSGRAAGVALSLYGLRSARNWGCGDFTDLRGVIDSFAGADVAFVALNPLHAIANRQPYNISPYLPQSSLFRNFIYLDVERVGTLRSGFDHEREIEALRASPFVEYEPIAEMKLRVLSSQFDHFLNCGGSVDFDRYIETEGELLHDFAVYCALEEEMHRRDPEVWIWRDWPLEYRDPRSRAVSEIAQEYCKRVLFYQFLQWQIDVQLAETQAYALEKGMRIGLYHDLALATDWWGADLWAHRPFYVAGCRVGSPPDDFSPKGQDWAFPPPNRDAHRESAYTLFIESIRKNARHGGALRIDHVMRLFRLYWIPDGMEATDGAYMRDYANDLLGILALESVRGKFVVIGEDLGTVTSEIRQTLAESGILSYRVLWFEKHNDGSFRQPDEYPAQAAVSSTTHDLPTLAGFNQGRDIEARRAAELIDEASYEAQLAFRREESRKLADALREAGFEGDPIGFLLSTPCALAIINQEDLTGEIDQQNLPGSTSQHPNWRRKMKVAVEDLGTLTEELKAAIVRSGRDKLEW